MQQTYTDRLILKTTCRNIGENINIIRRKQKITLKRMAKLTGLRMETIDCYELGKKTICLAQLLKISTALKIQPEKLMETQ